MALPHNRQRQRNPGIPRRHMQELGFGINSDRTIAFHEKFFIITEDEIVRVYWLNSDNLLVYLYLLILPI